jgi:hypothetical protein
MIDSILDDVNAKSKTKVWKTSPVKLKPISLASPLSKVNTSSAIKSINQDKSADQNMTQDMHTQNLQT